MPLQPHFVIAGRGRRYPYTFPRPVVADPEPRPPQDRAAHGAALRNDFESIREEMRPQWERHDRSAEFGVQVEFEGEVGFALRTDRLDLRSNGIEVVNTRTEMVPGAEGNPPRERQFATVFVPYLQLELFLRRVQAYLDKNGTYTDRRTREKKDTGPRNGALVDSIHSVRLAVVASFWTDTSRLPDMRVARWWEAWLRVGSADAPRRYHDLFIVEAAAVGMRIKGDPLVLPEQIVVLVFGSGEQMARSSDLLSCLAELRHASTTAAFFEGISNIEAQHWVQDLAARVRAPEVGAPALCLLDTGVNRLHPIISLGLPAAHCDAVVAGGPADQRGHGTQMAGLGLYGDLTDALQGVDPIQLEHGLESVKILPDLPHANEPETWGPLTQEAIARAEVFAPNRRRVVALAIGALDGRNGGKPSAWSTALDQAASTLREPGRGGQLIVTAAGNATREEIGAPLDYPRSNRRLAIHNPGQAWNALTVGAYTDKVIITQPGWRGPVAPRGAMAPCNATSVIWDNQWPIKPEIVCGGGNFAHAVDGGVDLADDLQLLTTGRDFLNRPLILTGDTSAAAILAARMGTRLHARYPTLWPESIRALLVHFAEWTPAMLGGADPWSLSEDDRRVLLRQVGYGVPDFARAAASGDHRVTLLMQDELQPYQEKAGAIVTNDFKQHDLPWPVEILQALLDTPVTLRVTLSYFVEPNPGPRDVDDKFRYAGAGLRFGLQRPGESATAFARRTSRSMAASAADPAAPAAETGRWLIGRLKDRGSLHNDVWRGRAADLAGRGKINVFPVTGWWRYRQHLGRYDSTIRYSLAVTIETPPDVPEIFTPIRAQVAAMIAAPVPIAVDL